MPSLSRQNLLDLYSSGLSMFEIAKQQKVSIHKVSYWMDKHGIPKRSRSEAIYIKKNPNGDPFRYIAPISMEKANLLGMGLGLYWGEGNKANKTSVRICNSDPALLRIFMKFLVELFQVNKKDLKFGLQIFNDIDTEKAINYWSKELKIDRSQFYKVIITKSHSLGTYKNKSLYGVMTVHYHNSRLRNLLMDMIHRSGLDQG